MLQGIVSAGVSPVGVLVVVSRASRRPDQCHLDVIYYFECIMGFLDTRVIHANHRQYSLTISHSFFPCTPPITSDRTFWHT